MNTLVILLFIALCLMNPGSGFADKGVVSTFGSTNVNPDEIVFLSNEMDYHFIKDFSILLKHSRVSWILLDQAALPESIRDKNLVLISSLDSALSGDLIRTLLTVEEVKVAQGSIENHIILEKENPWSEGHIMIIGLGADWLKRRDAAEEIFRTLISSSPPSSDWIRTTYEFTEDDDLRKTVSQLRYKWEDIELPLEDLLIDLDAKISRKVTAQQAVEDVERLFYLLSHGYSGYAFFNQEGAFEQAEEHILEALLNQSTWSPSELSKLLYEHLGFIVDRHLTIGDHHYAAHLDFWFDSSMEFNPGNNGYQFVKSGKTYTLESINDEDPKPFLFPSLNKGGDAIYRLGILSKEKPDPLLLKAIEEGGSCQFSIKLMRSDFDSYADSIFQEDQLGGIPVVRVQSFSDDYEEELDRYVKTASRFRDQPVVVVDIRGNGGGNERWPIAWIRGLTGRRAESIFVTSELESKTTMVGRANSFKYLIQQGSDSSFNTSNEDRYYRSAASFEGGNRQPRWTTPMYPKLPLIPNDTTVIVITNDQVASAGEGFVMRISQAENVVVVGENTMGALTFGNGSLHQLPNSKMRVWMPINFGIFSDQVFREEVGLTPDLWVPAADAVNYAIAAIRKGTISTELPLPVDMLEQKFVPESPWLMLLQMDTSSWLLMVVFIIGGGVCIFVNRKKVRFLLIIGVVWIGFSIFFINRANERGIVAGFLFLGILSLIAGFVRISQLRWSK